MDRPKYHIEIFWSDEDGGYIANVPVLRYCSAFGETYEEALHEVLEAMELHLDTLRELERPVPEPRVRSAPGDVVLGSSYGRDTQVPTFEDVDVTTVETVEEAIEQLRALSEWSAKVVDAVDDASEQAADDVSDTSISEIDLAVLTQRQREVLALSAQGFTNAQIARQLHRSVDTIKHHMREAAKVLGAARAVDVKALSALRRRPPR